MLVLPRTVILAVTFVFSMNHGLMMLKMMALVVNVCVIDASICQHATIMRQIERQYLERR